MEKCKFLLRLKQTQTVKGELNALENQVETTSQGTRGADHLETWTSGEKCGKKLSTSVRGRMSENKVLKIFRIHPKKKRKSQIPKTANVGYLKGSNVRENPARQSYSVLGNPTSKEGGLSSRNRPRGPILLETGEFQDALRRYHPKRTGQN